MKKKKVKELEHRLTSNILCALDTACSRPYEVMDAKNIIEVNRRKSLRKRGKHPTKRMVIKEGERNLKDVCKLFKFSPKRIRTAINFYWGVSGNYEYQN